MRERRGGVDLGRVAALELFDFLESELGGVEGQAPELGEGAGMVLQHGSDVDAPRAVRTRDSDRPSLALALGPGTSHIGRFLQEVAGSSHAVDAPSVCAAATPHSFVAGLLTSLPELLKSLLPERSGRSPSTVPLILRSDSS